ncbi:MAG: gliding motility-associated C-terminal domain-containing protein [Bacteroides sp.]|nr:gliding motility-associated C-terminal domain-containing protein [Bacteroides sp.]
MKRILIAPVLAVMVSLSLSASSLEWKGDGRKVLSVVAPAASGLAEIFVVYGTEGRSVGYPAPSASDVKWYRYSSLGGGYAEQITDVVYADGVSSPARLEGDMGYIVETGGKQYCFWVVDYSRHPLSINSVTESDEKDCSMTTLNIVGTGDEMVYYGINGRRFTLDREIAVSYNTLIGDAENMTFTETVTTETIPYISSQLHVEAPLCRTAYTITGDRFLREWGEELEYVSSDFAPYAVRCLTSAHQSERDADNEVNPGAGSSSFGGSAPCDITFDAAVTDGALFKEWQLTRYEDFEDVNLRIQELTFDYTFTEEGVTYVRFVCANADGSCESYSDVYTVSIGASSLKCPNAFSPNGDGLNDEWKVSYSSIVRFECHIFDRYGHEMAVLSDPAQGWDGKYKGKTVPSGAYYYVIKATGADGKDYKLAGDINIVNYKE